MTFVIHVYICICVCVCVCARARLDAHKAVLDILHIY
jgi:hypothetical protein